MQNLDFKSNHVGFNGRNIQIPHILTQKTFAGWGLKGQKYCVFDSSLGLIDDFLLKYLNFRLKYVKY